MLTTKPPTDNALPLLIAALARIPSGGVHAVRPSRVGVRIRTINTLCDAGFVIWNGRHRPTGQSTLSLCSRTEAGEAAVTEALRAGL